MSKLFEDKKRKNKDENIAWKPLESKLEKIL